MVRLDSSAWRPLCALYSHHHIHLQHHYWVHTLTHSLFHSRAVLISVSIFVQLRMNVCLCRQKILEAECDAGLLD